VIEVFVARLSAYFLCLLLIPFSVLSESQQRLDPALKISKWKAVNQGFSLELVQVNKDYARAVFYARGLPEEVVEDIGRYCIFGSIVKNLSALPLTYRLADWRVVAASGTEHKMKLKSEWIKEWSAKGVGFRWLLLADEQTFDEGDWIQGFTTMALKPGETFDLHYSWSVQGKIYHQTFKGMQCAPAKTDAP